MYMTVSESGLNRVVIILIEIWSSATLKLFRVYQSLTGKCLGVSTKSGWQDVKEAQYLEIDRYRNSQKCVQ